jgi:hypothetical protein
LGGVLVGYDHQYESEKSSLFFVLALVGYAGRLGMNSVHALVLTPRQFDPPLGGRTRHNVLKELGQMRKSNR